MKGCQVGKPKTEGGRVFDFVNITSENNVAATKRRNICIFEGRAESSREIQTETQIIFDPQVTFNF